MSDLQTASSPDSACEQAPADIVEPTEAELSELHDILTEYGLPNGTLTERQEEVLIAVLERALEAIWEVAHD